MGKFGRFVLFALGAIVLLVLLAAVALPMFLNADSFRARIEASLAKSLGRKVTIGKLSLAVWSGGLLAENATVADDPQFSQQPFVEVDSVKIGVELLPLILHREVQIRGFSLQSPRIQLLRAANGTWNYSSIGGGGSRTSDADTQKTFPDLTVGHVEVANGRITVGSQAAAGTASTPQRVYEGVDLDVKNFGFTNSFPFTASAHLPGEGTVNISGTAGPLNQQDASATPFSGHLELKHIDPLAAGFVDPADGISGLVEALVLDASWSGQQMHVTRLSVDSPHLTVVRNNAPKAPKPPTAEGTSMLQHLLVDTAEVKNGAVTLTTAGQAGAPAVYQAVNAQISNLSPTGWSPFTLSAQLPGGGSLSATGKAGPFDTDKTASTPLDAQVTLKHVELETSGVLAPDAGINGMADLQAQVRSDGETLNATGTAHIAGIKLARDGQPSAKPVDAQFTVAQNERTMTGEIRQATVGVGRVALNLAGTYQASGPTTAINLHVNGQSLPIDEIEAFLPALGVHLPQGSQLRGGTITANLTVSGSTANPVITGPVRVEGTQLAGFDLGSKLQTLSKLTGGRIGGATGSGTTIRSLSMDVRSAGGAIRTDKIALDVAGLGTATGAGGVSAGGALDYDMVMKLTGLSSATPAASGGGSQGGGSGGVAGILGQVAGLAGGATGGKGLGSLGGLAGGVLNRGIPVAIRGTTSNPSFQPNVSGLALGIGANAAQGFLNGKTGTKTGGKSPDGKVVGDSIKGALGGLLGRHR